MVDALPNGPRNYATVQVFLAGGVLRHMLNPVNQRQLQRQIASQVEWVQNSKLLQPIIQALAPGYPWYEALYILGIIFFAYFYVSIVMKPDDIADNFRKSGSFIPGIRPGKRTSDFINDILTRITLVGALYLIIISLVPTFLISASVSTSFG